MKEVWVIAPDKPSGDAFNKVLNDLGIKTVIDYPKIAPRVIGDQMNSDPQVQNDLAQAIKKAYDSGLTDLVIACNTLQLWLDKALNLIPEIKIKVWTTFEAVEETYPNCWWLGTKVLCKEIKGKFKILDENLQDLTQEIIWRTKAVYGADVTTALKNIEKIDDKKLLGIKVKELKSNLIDKKNVVLGCTELPMVMEGINPAEIVGEIILKKNFL